MLRMRDGENMNKNELYGGVQRSFTLVFFFFLFFSPLSAVKCWSGYTSIFSRLSCRAAATTTDTPPHARPIDLIGIPSTVRFESVLMGRRFSLSLSHLALVLFGLFVLSF